MHTEGPRVLKVKKIANVVPALTARAQFGQILKRVRQNKERFIVGRRGEAQAVIMGTAEYLNNFAAEAPALKKVQTGKSKGTNRLRANAINAEIKRYRRQQRT